MLKRALPSIAPVVSVQPHTRVLCSDIISKLLADGDSHLRGRLIGVYAFLIGANVLIWAWALGVLHDKPVLLGTALLAYSFGLRHAVDADHIAAIDNVTRKLMQQGQRPVGVGFCFSLGHSLVVVLLSAAVAFAASAVSGSFDSLKAFGDVVGTSISALFLFAIAFFNILVLISVYRTFQAVKRGEPFVEDDFDLLLNSRGFLARIFRPLFRLVSRSWHMLPIGFLFGLGLRHRDRSRAVRHFGRLRPRKASPPRRSWSSPRCSPRACRWWIRRTAC